MVTKPTCDAKATITIGDLTEADVECGKDPHGPDENHLAVQNTKANTETKSGADARILYVWRA